MASVVDICNLALSYLGDEATLASVDPAEGSAQADHCARFFPIALGYMLEQRAWSFATRRVELADLSGIDLGGWKHVYAHPQDCVRIVSLTLPDDKYYECPQDFIVEAHPTFEGARIIRTDADGAVCRYVHDCRGLDSFSQAFSQACAYFLAHLLAGAMLSGASGMKVSEEMLKLFQTALVRATEFDAQQSRHAYDSKAHWTNRYYGGKLGGHCHG